MPSIPLLNVHHHIADSKVSAEKKQDFMILLLNILGN